MSTSWTLNISRVMLITKMNYMITVLKENYLTRQRERKHFLSKEDFIKKFTYIFTVFIAHILHIINHIAYQNVSVPI